MNTDSGSTLGLSWVLSKPPYCWCCERVFGNEGVEQMPEYREWLAWNLEIDVPPWGICMECAKRRKACAQCGRVAILDDIGDVFLQTRALDDTDTLWVRTAKLEALVGLCECCVVREHLMDHDVVQWSLSKEVTYDVRPVVDGRCTGRQLGV